MSTWRGFQSGPPIWTLADFVILTEYRGRERYFECYMFGRHYKNFPRLEDAKVAVESEFGVLDWQQVKMEPVEVVHYYFGPTTEFTDPLVAYLADL